MMKTNKREVIQSYAVGNVSQPNFSFNMPHVSEGDHQLQYLSWCYVIYYFVSRIEQVDATSCTTLHIYELSRLKT